MRDVKICFSFHCKKINNKIKNVKVEKTFYHLNLTNYNKKLCKILKRTRKNDSSSLKNFNSKLTFKEQGIYATKNVKKIITKRNLRTNLFEKRLKAFSSNEYQIKFHLLYRLIIKKINEKLRFSYTMTTLDLPPFKISELCTRHILLDILK